jgi:hypothetical protein
VYFIRPNTLLLYIVLFCIFLLYQADPQVEVQFRILLKDKYICTIVSEKYRDLLQAYSHDRFPKISIVSQKYRELSVQVEISE